VNRLRESGADYATGYDLEARKKARTGRPGSGEATEWRSKF